MMSVYMENSLVEKYTVRQHEKRVVVVSIVAEMMENIGRRKMKMCNECKRCDGDLCTYFDNYSDRESTIACILFEPKNPTVFDHITQSVEALAEKLVYWEQNPPESGWTSNIGRRNVYRNYDEAVAATIKELKKEWEK
jgi:hypothetical protein